MTSRTLKTSREGHYKEKREKALEKRDRPKDAESGEPRQPTSSKTRDRERQPENREFP
jgi:hypothetical protein